MSITALQLRLAPLLRPASAVYGAAMRLRAASYASRRRVTPYRAAVPVISVGNISWGGTGKTPVVEYLLGKTAEAGLRTAVLTRGYKASPPELPFAVSGGDEPARAGDEPLLLARLHPEAMVLVDPKRARAAAWAEEHAQPRLFLLDDGMQHLAIERDLDLVLLTPDDLLEGWNRVIPAGSWREDASALSRADAFCMKLNEKNIPGLVSAAEKRLAKLGRPLFFFDLRPTGLTRLVPYGGTLRETVPDLCGSPYVLVCGTGNPDHVRQTAMSLLGREPSDCLIVQDHHHYSETDAAAVRKSGHPVVCTAKDAVKLAALLPRFSDIPIWVLDARTVFSQSLFTDLSFDAWWEANLKRLLALQFDVAPPNHCR